jgi:hypothetical protein
VVRSRRCIRRRGRPPTRCSKQLIQTQFRVSRCAMP